MSSSRTRCARNKNFRAFRESRRNTPSTDEQSKFNFTASFVPEQLDFSKYLENVKSQSQELQKGEKQESCVDEKPKAVNPQRETVIEQVLKPPRCLIGAVSSKNVQLLEEILQESNSAEISSNQLNHALMFSITMREAAITERLLKAGADMHAFDSCYPILLTAVDIKATDIVDVLIKHCKDVNLSSNYGNLLHSAARTGEMDLVKRAFELGVDVNFQCKANKSTPFHEAVKSVKFNGKGVLEGSFSFTYNKNKRNHSQIEDESALDAKSELDQEKGSSQEATESKEESTKKGNYDMDVIAFLLSKNCNIDAQDIKGKTALHHACHLGNCEVIEYLLKAGANPHIIDESNNIPVMYALNHNNYILVKMLIKQESLNKPVVKSEYYVHMTSKCGNVKCLKYLIDNGADLTVKDTHDHGNTPLMVAISNCAKIDYVRCLLKQECGLNEVNSQGETAFSMLLTKYHSLPNLEDYVKLLVEAGVDVNKVDPSTGMTQLMVYANNLNIVDCLLKHGGDVNRITKTGDNVLLKACQFEKEDIVRTILNHGMDLSLTEIVNTEGSNANLTPLQICVTNSAIELTEMLLCAGASLRNMHQWIKQSNHCGEWRKINSTFEAVCQYIEATTRGPPRLSELCRVSVLKAVGPAPSEARLDELCLPTTIKQELPWEMYLSDRTKQFRSMSNIEE